MNRVYFEKWRGRPATMQFIFDADVDSGEIFEVVGQWPDQRITMLKVGLARKPASHNW